MEKLEVFGANMLKGQVRISGSKNASLPILAATLLSDKKIQLSNLPKVKDIEIMLLLLKSLDTKIKYLKNNKLVSIENNKKNKTFVSYSLVKTMRAGILVLGPLLARYSKAKISLPGGCAIGTRPIDIHLKALSKLGVSYKIVQGYVHANAPKGLVGTKIKFAKISVGATENLIIAASLAKGQTILSNCAIEPEIKDLVNFLNKMGCKINWIGKRINPQIIRTEIDVLKKVGAKIKLKNNHIIIQGNKKIKNINIKTAPYPGFPTDLQAQMMALLCKADKRSVISEKIFENRFMHVAELNRMGAKIKIKGNNAIIEGNTKFEGAELMATDLRASVSLILAALTSKSKSKINRIYHLDRGYEQIEIKLRKIGAKIKRLA